MKRKVKTRTVRHYEVLEVIKKFMSKHKYAPTFREIGKLMGIEAISQVGYYVNLLEREGLINREKKISRGIQIAGRKMVHKLGTPRIDGRKRNSEATMAKKAQAGKLGMGVNALERKTKSLRDPGLEARIDLVVAMAEKNQSASGEDVVHYDRGGLSSFRAKGARVG